MKKLETKVIWWIIRTLNWNKRWGNWILRQISRLKSLGSFIARKVRLDWARPNIGLNREGAGNAVKPHLSAGLWQMGPRRGDVASATFVPQCTKVRPEQNESSVTEGRWPGLLEGTWINWDSDRAEERPERVAKACPSGGALRGDHHLLDRNGARRWLPRQDIIGFGVGEQLREARSDGQWQAKDHPANWEIIMN